MITGWGFEPSINLVDDPAAFIAHEPFDHIDLIVVDYNLGENLPHGQSFISGIRDHSVLTEVIFYSANPASELWDAIRTSQLEGIFVSNKEGVVAKIESVALQSLRKVLDLNNMRGLIMAAIGDLDQQIDALLLMGCAALPSESLNKVFAKFYDGAKGQSEVNAAALEEFRIQPSIDAMIRLSDSSKKWDNLRRLKKADVRLKDIALDDYGTEVLFPRNCLAHGIPSGDGPDKIFTFHSKTFLYNEDTSRDLRQNIMKYMTVISHIGGLLKG